VKLAFETVRFDATYTPTSIRLTGLDATKNYRIKEINLYPGTSSSLNASNVFGGDFLIKNGYNPDLNSQRSSVVLEITAE